MEFLITAWKICTRNAGENKQKMSTAATWEHKQRTAATRDANSSNN